MNAEVYVSDSIGAVDFKVNKLLDLMVDEKKCLHQKIAKLEVS